MVLLLHVACFLAVALFNEAFVNAAKKTEDCSPFPFVNLDNGHIVRTGHQKYIFKCDQGYFLASSPAVRCFHGNWTSDKEPKCLKIEGLCDDPPEVDHAVVHGEDRAIGSKIKYTCKPGFQLVGKGDMTCSRSGHWDGRTPTCMDESEPLKKVAHRLKNSFIDELSYRPEDNKTNSDTEDANSDTEDANSDNQPDSDTEAGPQGKLLDRGSLKHGLDLVIVIDRSSSVDPVHLEDAKNFVNFLLRRFGVKNEPRKNGGTQAAVLTFGTEVQVVFNMNNYNITGPLAASQAVGTIEPNGGGTNIEGALTMVIIQVSPFLRKKAKKALFLMTDGVPNIESPGITAEDMARQLRDNYKFEIFTVGIGKEINRNFLAEIASKPPLSHVFILTEYPDLQEIMKLVEDEQPPAPPASKNQCGYEAHGEKNPWLAILYISGGGSQRRMRLCGGVLICSEWVLTAASCFLDGEERIPNKEVFVTLGERDLLRDEQNQTNFYVLDIKLHSRFDPSVPLNHNVALVKLNTPAKRYRPACLPRTDTNMPLHEVLNANTSIAGWGLNTATPTHPSGASVRFKITTSLVSLAQVDECPRKKNDMSLFCAGQGMHTCLGLMGSPIIAPDPTTRLNHILGVVAGRSHCLKGNNQYIELTRYINWINLSTDLCQQKHWD